MHLKEKTAHCTPTPNDIVGVQVLLYPISLPHRYIIVAAQVSTWAGRVWMDKFGHLLWIKLTWEFFFFFSFCKTITLIEVCSLLRTAVLKRKNKQNICFLCGDRKEICVSRPARFFFLPHFFTFRNGKVFGSCKKRHEWVDFDGCLRPYSRADNAEVYRQNCFLC